MSTKVKQSFATPNTKMLRDYYKAIKVVKSVETNEHIKYCRVFIDLFELKHARELTTISPYQLGDFLREHLRVQKVIFDLPPVRINAAILPNSYKGTVNI